MGTREEDRLYGHAGEVVCRDKNRTRSKEDLVPELWAGTDAGKTDHHCTVIDTDGKTVAEAGRFDGDGGRFNPFGQLVALQVGEHVSEGAHVLGECGQCGAVGQDGLELEPVVLGQSVEVGQKPAGDGAGRRWPGSDRLGLATKSPAHAF
ncbi:hypothetical protein ACFC09_39850 [Streptomyces sp. NPDC056161]|uniref:hypothetical protein n=1 Tax=Streptomyces sp. NPDC056161 TaxID=3345732 RepID=UPI0035DF06F3